MVAFPTLEEHQAVAVVYRRVASGSDESKSFLWAPGSTDERDLEDGQERTIVEGVLTIPLSKLGGAPGLNDKATIGGLAYRAVEVLDDGSASGAARIRFSVAKDGRPSGAGTIGA